MTVAGESPGMKCIFPFVYEGVTHNACTKHGIEHTEYEPWCSTNVDKFGGHVSGGGHWGDCGQECSFEPGMSKIIVAFYSNTVNIFNRQLFSNLHHQNETH